MALSSLQGEIDLLDQLALRRNLQLFLNPVRLVSSISEESSVGQGDDNVVELKWPPSEYIQ